MAVRFRRQGTTNINDHKDLINKGNRTHAEIDTYLAEIDDARGDFVDLDKRFDGIESKQLAYEIRLTDVEDKNSEQDERLTNVEATNSEQDTNLVEIQDNLSQLKDNILNIDRRVIDLENEPVVSQEIIDSRTDKDGVVYPSLKERLDAQQGKGGDGSGGGKSSNYLFEVFKNTFESTKAITLTKGTYVVGTNELEVFQNGIRLRRDYDYTETDGRTVTFTETLNLNDNIIFRIRDRENSILPLHIEQEHVIINSVNQKTFSLKNTFMEPGKSVEVHYNGLLLANNEDYTLDNNTINLLFEPIIGSLFLFLIVDKNHNKRPKLIEEHLTSIDGQTTYTLNTLTFGVGDNELELYINGVKLTSGIDFTEINESTFQLSKAPGDGLTILAIKENSPLESSVSTPNPNPPVDVGNGIDKPSINYTYIVPGGVTTDIITLPSSYNLGENELLVFLNGMAVSFEEVDETTIKTPVIIEEGDYVFVYRTSKKVIQLNQLCSLKQNEIIVAANETVILPLDIVSSAIDIKYMRFTSTSYINGLFEVIESPTDNIPLLSLQCSNESVATFNDVQPYNDEHLTNKLYLRITNNGNNSISYNLNIKYLVYSS